MLSCAGDELQGVISGIMEMADGIAITKADGDNIRASKQARTEYANAAHLFPPSPSGWLPQVSTCSSMKQEGLQEIWDQITQYQQHTQTNGYFLAKRKSQNMQWMQESISLYLEDHFYQHAGVSEELASLDQALQEGAITGLGAARRLISRFEAYKNRWRASGLYCSCLIA